MPHHFADARPPHYLEVSRQIRAIVVLIPNSLVGARHTANQAGCQEKSLLKLELLWLGSE
ncbi:hypothetical protein BM1_04007 [Bipolaris maydis]|nr:hypothetical protein BM1_04007 [Bipolaris maydis]